METSLTGNNFLYQRAPWAIPSSDLRTKNYLSKAVYGDAYAGVYSLTKDEDVLLEKIMDLEPIHQTFSDEALRISKLIEHPNVMKIYGYQVEQNFLVAVQGNSSILIFLR